MNMDSMLRKIDSINSINPNHNINDNTIMKYYNIHLFYMS